MPPLPSLSDAKSYLGLTTTGDDALLTTLLANAIAQAEQDTARTFASGSNVTQRYSTNGQTTVVIDDRPFTDPSRVVTLNGVTMIENTNVWFLPDRRDQNVTTTIQLRYFNMTGRWYLSDPFWWDKNLDNPRYANFGAAPNDLVISGVSGMPFPDQDVINGILVLVKFLYWDAKAGGSGSVVSPTGEVVELATLSALYGAFVDRWKIVTAVSSV